MTLPNRIVVSNSVGVRAHSRTKGKVFAVDYGTKEFPFYILSLKGKVGRPKLEDIKGYGVKTKVRIQSVNTGRVRTVTLASLVDRNIRYLGRAEYLYT